MPWEFLSGIVWEGMKSTGQHIKPTLKGAIHACIRKYPEYSKLERRRLEWVEQKLYFALSSLYLSKINKTPDIEAFCRFAVDYDVASDKPTKNITIPLVLPPKPNQLHLFILLKAFDFARIGAKVTILLEDIAYNQLSTHKVEWPTTASAFNLFYECLLRVSSTNTNYEQLLGNIAVVKQSSLFNSSHQEIIDSVLRQIHLDNDFIEAVNKLAVVRNRKISVYDICTLAESYLLTMIGTKPHYIVTGRDRETLNQILARILERQTNKPSPTVLCWHDVPNLRGNYKWTLDDEQNIYPFANSGIQIGKAKKKFKRWFNSKIAVRCEDDSTADCFFSKLVIQQKSAISLKQLCKLIKEKNDNILSVTCFGSYKDKIDLPLEQVKKTCIYSPEEGDIDLIFVVKQKSANTQNYLNKYLSPYGTVIHHPDFYSVRASNEKLFEVIVVPDKSEFFSKSHLGILTGLSVFTENRYKTIVGRSLKNSIKFPNIDNRDRLQRIQVYLKAQYGIKDVQSRLWPYLVYGNTTFDLHRIVRFTVIDIFWAETGVWCFETDKLISYVRTLAISDSAKTFLLETLDSKATNIGLCDRRDISHLYNFLSSIEIYFESSLNC